MYLDHQGAGGWDLVMGEGHDPAVIDKFKGPVLTAGHCAIREVGERLVKRLGKAKVYQSGYCNDLSATASAMFPLMKADPRDLVFVPDARAAWLLLAKLHGSKANALPVWAKLTKTV